MKRKLFIGILIFMTLIIIGSAYADFGGFSGGGGSSRSSSHHSSTRLRSRLYHGRASFFEDLKFALTVAGIAIFFFVCRLWDSIVEYFRRERIAGKLKPIDKFYEYDPSFSQNEITKFMTDLYSQMQKAWQHKNINNLSQYMTEHFKQVMTDRLFSLIKENRTDHTEKISVLNVKIEGWTRIKNYDYIRVELTSEIISYITDDKTCELVSGDRNIPIKMRYHVDLCREIEKISFDWKICDMTGTKI